MAEGYITTRVYASKAVLPLSNALITVSAQTAEGDEVLLSLQHTDLSGKTAPVAIPTPPSGLSLEPGNVQGYASVNISAYLPLYDRVLIRNVQVFSGITSIQNIVMIPQSTDGKAGTMQIVNVTPQDL